MRIGLNLLTATSLAFATIVLHGCDSGATAGKPPSAVASTMGPLEEGTNRQGRDLSQAGTRMASASQCSDLCASHPDCRAMSFAKNSGAEGGICFMKSEVPVASENAAVTSAVKTASAPNGQ